MSLLIPFSATTLTKKFSVKTNMRKKSDQLFLIEFDISGPIDLISWPSSPNPEPQRKDELWKTTCFEIFVSGHYENSGAYHEFNFSPNGDWNAYDFIGYRQGMTPSQDFSVLFQEYPSQRMQKKFAIEIKSTKIQNIKSYNLTMVLEFTNQEKSYWAAQHPATNADFHNKEVWSSI